MAKSLSWSINQVLKGGMIEVITSCLPSLSGPSIRPLLVHSFSEEKLESRTFEAPGKGLKSLIKTADYGCIYQYSSCAGQLVLRACSGREVLRVKDERFPHGFAGERRHAAKENGHRALFRPIETEDGYREPKD
jgi:hypothetical protein